MAISASSGLLPDGIRKAIDEGTVHTVHDWTQQEDSDINARDAKGRSALMLAATQGRSVIVQMLIDGGADLEMQQSLGSTAMMFACFTGDARIVAQVCQQLMSSAHQAAHAGKGSSS